MRVLTAPGQDEFRSGQFFKSMVKTNLDGLAVGVCSVCSAHPAVIRATLAEARERESVACIESTSNQVNQLGGYTGMTPPEFVAFVEDLAREVKFPRERIILGGDHLGPYVWRNAPAREAMERARELVRAYVAAGFSKIHLDASMRCADDPCDERGALDERTVTRRAADLCQAAESAASGRPESTRPVYVIGTEVPLPGGESTVSDGPGVTSLVDVSRTLELSRDAFLEYGLSSAWDRVVAVVVQPGVEYGDTSVFGYERSRAAELSLFAKNTGTFVYEAHSTDYQTPRALRELVEDHFAVLKVGPWLTFAFREAVFALCRIEEEWLADHKSITLSEIPAILEGVMRRQPDSWMDYYRGDESQLRYACKYSYSDRSRYYWPQPALREALDRLVANLGAYPPPLALFSQYLPAQYRAVRDGELALNVHQLIEHKIREVLKVYWEACGAGRLEETPGESQGEMTDQAAARPETAELSQTAPGELRLIDFAPRSVLKVRETTVEKPRFPVIDFHTHLSWSPGFAEAGPNGGDFRLLASAAEILPVMARRGLRMLVNVTGGAGSCLEQTLDHFQRRYPDRFLVFTEPWWNRLHEPDYPRFQAEQIEEAARKGVRGLKILKTLGLYLRENLTTGRLVAIDDRRYDPMWEAAAGARMPVLIHVSDPEAFFAPIDRFNERYEELHSHPDWSFHGDFPSNRELQEARNRVVERHPGTRFVLAHMGHSENLESVGEWLDRYPNLHVEFGARIGELGRQPRTARRFFEKYQDRILFGTDAVPHGDEYPQQVFGDELYRIYYRFLETEDEYFDYAPADIPPQGRWRIYGLGLPESILRKVYYENAARLLGIQV